MISDKLIYDITGTSYRNLENILPEDIDKDLIIWTIEGMITRGVMEHHVPDDPFLINISGIPCSRKSTYCKKLLAGENIEEPDTTECLYISFDAIMENPELPYLSERKTDAEKAYSRWELPARVTGYEFIRRAVERRLNILLEHSSSIVQHKYLFKQLIASGYDVHFRHIDISVAEAMKRLEKRSFRNMEQVRKYITERNGALRKLLPEYKKMHYIQNYRVMATTLIIARHGNTFRPEQSPTRVGAKTDLPLVEEHRGISIGKYLYDKGLIPSVVYAAPLRRTMKTAELAIKAMDLDIDVLSNCNFTEIDYGPDENRTEEEIRLRLGGGDPEKGKSILDAWNSNATVPDGWIADPNKIISDWMNFAESVEKDQTVLLVSSNGIIRFSPYLTGDFEGFSKKNDIKVSTGGICIFEREDGDKYWKCTEWNTRPYKLYPEYK